jgi:quercetin dioxygenase-like cupin family protein
MTAKSTARAEAPIVLSAEEGDAVWFNNDLLVFKATASGTGGAFILVEELTRRGKATPLHTHPEETEAFYVLEGEALFELDGEQRSIGAGGFVSVPPTRPHAYAVTSELARLLVLVTPGRGMEAFFREAGEPARERALPPEGPLDIERLSAAAEHTGAVEILGPPPFG